MKNSDIRVGLLAYGAIGHEHNQAVQNTSGLVLSDVCDTNSDRVKAALTLAPGATTFMALIRSGSREDASQLAPPHGLCLWEVGYPTTSE